MSIPQFYTDRESAVPGTWVAIHASAAQRPYQLELVRVCRERQATACFDGIALAEHPVPANVEQVGCGWPAAFGFQVGADWPQGCYDPRLVQADESASHHYLMVKRAASCLRAEAVLILATNTCLAYNYWGDANCYEHVQKLLEGQVDAPGPQAQADGRLSRM